MIQLLRLSRPQLVSSYPVSSHENSVQGRHLSPELFETSVSLLRSGHPLLGRGLAPRVDDLSAELFETSVSLRSATHTSALDGQFIIRPYTPFLWVLWTTNLLHGFIPYFTGTRVDCTSSHNLSTRTTLRLYGLLWCS